MTTFELWYGAFKGAYADENTRRLRLLLGGGVEVAAFGAEDAEAAGALRAQLERAGTPIGPYDLLIAAHARRLWATLVTANVGEFSRVPGLTVENWSLPE